MNSFDMQVVHISCHITTTKYKNFKMINLIHIVSILNFVFTIVFYTTGWTKQDLICICFKKIKINLIYSIFEYVYIYNTSRFIGMWANEPHYELWPLSGPKIYT
jgi:hypothetical protein